MVHTCVVTGCRNRRTLGTSLSFYRFPRDPERKQRWIAAVNREGWVPNDGSRLCSHHFISGKQVKNPRSPDYVPTVFAAPPPSPEMKETGSFELLDKQEAQVEAANALLFLQGQGRVKCELGQNQEDHEAAETATSSSSSEEGEESDLSSDSKSRGGKPTKMSAAPTKYEDTLLALKKENRALREAVEKQSLTETSLKNDPEKVRFYTGLPNYFVVETVMWLLAPHMDGVKNVKLAKFQQLLLTLMRLRLDLRNQDLAYRFGVKVGTVTRTVHRMVNIMSNTLVPTAVFWPSRAELRKNLPAALRATYPDCAVIVDCFTVTFEKAASQTSLPEAAGTPSAQGAGRNTLKYLIGVAPQGVVTFVSRGSPGDVSDKSVAEGCGFLCKLLPGDVVLAERDLEIGESVAACGALFQVTGGHAYDGNSSLEEASLERQSVRRHVERVIAMVKQRYAMLAGPVESCFMAAERTSNLTTFDKIVQVACALNNLCISAAPLE